MEKIPEDKKIKIGEQVFTRVGNVSEPGVRDSSIDGLSLFYTDKKGDTYYDIDNGALMSEVPTDKEYTDKRDSLVRQREKKELQEENKRKGILLKEQSENLDIDLTSLTAEETHSLFTKSDRAFCEISPVRVVALDERKGYMKEYTMTSRYVSMDPTEHLVVLSPVDTAEYNENNDYRDRDKGEIRILENRGSAPKYQFERVIGKNSIELSGNGEPVSTIQFSFLEVPEAYTELMKQKKN